MSEKRKVFIVGWDDFNLKLLKRLPEAGDCEFYPAVKFSEMRDQEGISISGLLKLADQRIEAAGGIDAVVSYFDFPGTLLVPVIAEKYGLNGPSLESVLKCEHKYWSRLEQKKVIPLNIPHFKSFDPFDANAFDKIGFTPPYWVKPAKSYHSYLAYQITDSEQFHQCMKEVQAHINDTAEPFSELLDMYNFAEKHPELKVKMFAETELLGQQCTAEGYVYNQEVNIYGIVDTVRIPGSPSFARYEYPGSLPEKVNEKIIELSGKVIRHIGLNQSAFNIEFFYTQEDDNLYVLEINPRISQSHAALFEKVHGVSHHETMLNLALNRPPRPYEFKGGFNVAGNFMHRAFHSGKVMAVPSEKEISRLKEKFPDLEIKINVKQNMDLEDLPPYHIDSYSYVLANIFIGASTRQELLKKFDYIINSLTFKIESEEPESS